MTVANVPHVPIASRNSPDAEDDSSSNNGGNNGASEANAISGAIGQTTQAVGQLATSIGGAVVAAKQADAQQAQAAAQIRNNEQDRGASVALSEIEKARDTMNAEDQRLLAMGTGRGVRNPVIG